MRLGLGHLAEAESLLRPCLDGSIRVFGPEHPKTLVIIRHLAVVLAARGQVDEAERLFRSCLEAQSRSLGTEHRETRETAELLNGLLTAVLRRSTRSRNPLRKLARTDHLVLSVIWGKSDFMEPTPSHDQDSVAAVGALSS